jgi:hypothetical protein
MEPQNEEAQESPVPSGTDWLDLFLQSHGKVSFEMAWITFGMGQVGAAAHLGDERAGEMLDGISDDIDDLEASCGAMIRVLRDMHANAVRNLIEDRG